MTVSRFTTLTLLLGAVLLIASPGLRAADEARLITVQGEAERRVPPDMATLRMEVQTQGLEAAAARREADELTGKALAILRGSGIAEADLDSTGLAVNPQYRWVKDEQRQQLTGYRVSRTITARVMDLEQLGPLLVALSDGGVNRVQPPRLDVADDEAIHRELLAAAAVNARERAQVIAAALGEKLGAVDSVTVNGPTRAVPMQMARMAMAAESADASAGAETYAAGYITFNASVAASFALD